MKIKFLIFFVSIYIFNNSKKLIESYIKNEKCLLKKEFIKKSCNIMTNEVKQKISIYLLNCNLKTLNKKEICLNQENCKKEINENIKLLIDYLKHFFNYCNYLNSINLENFITKNNLILNNKLSDLSKEININNKLSKNVLKKQNDLQTLSNSINLNSTLKVKSLKFHLEKEKKKLIGIFNEKKIYYSILKNINFKLLCLLIFLFILIFEVLKWFLLFKIILFIFICLFYFFNFYSNDLFFSKLLIYFNNYYFIFLNICALLIIIAGIIRFYMFLLNLKKNVYKR